jgi:hypothetical protein
MVTQTMEERMTTKHEPTFIKVLETDSLIDIALIKSVLEGEGVRYFIQGENMAFNRPVIDSAVLMVAEGDLQTAVDLLKPLELNFTWAKVW